MIVCVLTHTIPDVLFAEPHNLEVVCFGPTQNQGYVPPAHTKPKLCCSGLHKLLVVKEMFLIVIYTKRDVLDCHLHKTICS